MVFCIHPTLNFLNYYVWSFIIKVFVRILEYIHISYTSIHQIFQLVRILLIGPKRICDQAQWKGSLHNRIYSLEGADPIKFTYL